MNLQLAGDFTMLQTMISRLHITGLRGIQEGLLESLVSLNVLVGPNNSGKSTVLEALHLAAARQPVDVHHVIVRRGWIGSTSLTALIPQKTSVLKTTNSQSGKETSCVMERLQPQLALSLPGIMTHMNADGSLQSGNHPDVPSPTFLEPASVATDPAHLERQFSAADLSGSRETLLRVLRPLLSTLKDLRILVVDSRPTLYVEDATGLWPAIAAGDGFKRLLMVAASIAQDRSGQILIEEPETHLHVGALPQIVRVLQEATATRVPLSS